MRKELTRTTQEYRVNVEITNELVKLDDFVTKNKKRCRRYKEVKTGRHSVVYEKNNTKNIRSAITLWGNMVEIMSRPLVEKQFIPGRWYLGQ
jgi:hypothetical protein